MSNFNLENYETVKERKKRFYEKYPDGSIVTELVHFEKGHVVIRASVYRNKEEQEKGLPTGVGHAEEFQGQGGFANKFSWMENCDESACGRALDQAGFAGNSCSREEMQKVKNHEETEKTKGNFEDAVKKINQCTFKSFGVTLKNLNELFEWTDEEKDKLRIVAETKKRGLENDTKK